MNDFSLKKVFGKGLLIAIPLGVVVYIGLKIFEMLGKVIEPISKQFGAERIFGELTVTILVVFVLLMFVFILGLLMRVAIFASFGKNLEEIVFKFFPSLNQLKVTAAEKLDLETNTASWKPVLLFFENKYNAAFVIEKNDTFITLFVIKGIDISSGEILITKIQEVQIQEISSKELHQYTRQYGKGFLSMLKEI
jgi:uncharacterized membrane protein